MKQSICLICWCVLLSTVGCLGPSPVTTESRAKYEYAWSEPVDGVKVRIFPTRTMFQTNDTLRFRLEFQNVSGSSLAFPIPQIMPVMAPPGNHPFKDDSPFTCVLTARPEDGDASILFAAREPLLWEQEMCFLKPNGILRVNISCPDVLKEREDKEMGVAEEASLVQHEAQLSFGLGHDVGRYEVAGWHEYPRKPDEVDIPLVGNVWTGKIEFPCVVVTVGGNRNTEQPPERDK
jgi:hypothetical protein